MDHDTASVPPGGWKLVKWKVRRGLRGAPRKMKSLKANKMTAKDIGDEVLISISAYNYASTSLDYQQANSLFDWLFDWLSDQREKCSGCKHERDGCLMHD